MKRDFDLAGLAAMDGGRIGVAFATELQKCIDDVVDRPALKKARSVVIQIDLEPVGATGTEDVGATARVVAKLPPRQSRKYNMGLSVDPKGREKLVFNDEAPESHRQGTLDEQARKGQEKK